MKEAIEDYQRAATTVTTRSIDQEFEPPALTFCSNPPFKPSKSKKYQLDFPARDLFYVPTNITKQIYEERFNNKTVQEMYEEFSYSDELKFVFWDEYLTVGKNKLKYVYEGAAVDVELIEVPTIGLGLCHVIQLKNVSSWDEKSGLIVIEHEITNPLDVIKSFNIYFSQRNDWHGIVTENWIGTYQPLKVDTSSYSLPLEVEVNRLSQNQYRSLHHKSNDNLSKDLSSQICLNYQNVTNIYEANNCTDPCIPIVYSSLFDISNIKECLNYDSHFCAINEVRDYIMTQQETCMKPMVEKYFNGMVIYREGISHDYTYSVSDKRKNQTVLLFWWDFDSNDHATLYEEKLVYDDKDLLAWLGGAFGIFVGYSFLDFFNRCVDIIFYSVYKVLEKRRLGLSNQVFPETEHLA